MGEGVWGGVGLGGGVVPFLGPVWGAYDFENLLVGSQLLRI